MTNSIYERHPMLKSIDTYFPKTGAFARKLARHIDRTTCFDTELFSASEDNKGTLLVYPIEVKAFGGRSLYIDVSCLDSDYINCVWLWEADNGEYRVARCINPKGLNQSELMTAICCAVTQEVYLR